MKIRSISVIFLILIIASFFPEEVNGRTIFKSVLFNEHTYAPDDGDSTDISGILNFLITRQENKKQFNRLIGVYVLIAADSLKINKSEVAEKIIFADALPMLTRYGDDYNKFHCFMLLGKSYFSQKKYTQAKWFFLQANGTAERLRYQSGKLFSLLELAHVKATLQDNRLALDDYKKAANMAVKMKFNSTLQQIKKYISELNNLIDSPGITAIATTKNVE